MELLQSMQVFAKVADLGSFTKTADALQIGRPQVTHTIQALESSLGVRLFHRTTRRVTLTAEGETFYQRVTDILSDVAEATSLFAAPGGQARGRLRIDLPVALAQPKFIASLHEFNDVYPDISLVLGVTDRRLDLVAEAIDCVLRIGELPDSSLIGKRIGAVSIITCAAPSYLAQFGVPETVEDLSQHRAVNYFSGSSRKLLDWRFRSEDGEQTLNIRSGILVNDSAAFVQAGIAGFGILQGLSITVKDQLASGALVEVLPTYRPAPRAVSILYPSKAHLAGQVRAFIEWVSDRFPAMCDGASP